MFYSPLAVNIILKIEFAKQHEDIASKCWNYQPAVLKQMRRDQSY